MLTDLRKASTGIPYFFIDVVKVEGVASEYKYLGTVLDNKLNFNNQHRLYSQKLSANDIWPLKAKIS